MFAKLKAYASLIIALCWAASVAWAFFYGAMVGEGRAAEQQAREDALVWSAVDAANRTAAEAIAKIEVKNVTVRQEVQREVIKEPVYLECKHTPGVLRGINDALSGAESSGSGKLPGADASR